jgi:lysozyme family protein
MQKKKVKCKKKKIREKKSNFDFFFCKVASQKALLFYVIGSTHRMLMLHRLVQLTPPKW